MDVANSTRRIALAAALMGCLACSGSRAPEPVPAEADAEPGARVESEEPAAVPEAPAPPAPEIYELDPGEALLADEADAASRDDALPAEPPDPGARLARSLEAYESASAFWEQGAFDDAFAALDRAYELMASVPMNGDPLLAQEKENLRHLISRRVVEIHASRQAAVGDPNRSIRVTVNEDVRREIALFHRASVLPGVVPPLRPLPADDPGAPPGRRPAGADRLAPPRGERVQVPGPFPRPGPGASSYRPRATGALLLGG